MWGRVEQENNERLEDFHTALLSLYTTADVLGHARVVETVTSKRQTWAGVKDLKGPVIKTPWILFHLFHLTFVSVHSKDNNRKPIHTLHSGLKKKKQFSGLNAEQRKELDLKVYAMIYLLILFYYIFMK